ncbi:uncharacterized protein [Nicotiana tomentosiformis]|uniref:uncharacterized protein n=1 Tax=Nicotiana tomentosiformis TaxID=4098 RepID=UPI00388C9676
MSLPPRAITDSPQSDDHWSHVSFLEETKVLAVGVNLSVLLPSGTPSEDPQDYLKCCYEVLRNMGIVETNGVDFAFLPITLREEYHKKFEHLQQGNMIVTQYESHFVDLARHALFLLPTEGERVRRFIEGPTHLIRFQMAKEIGSEISFQAAANVARRIEMVLEQGNFGRGHPLRPFHSALHASHGASRSHGPIIPYYGQPAFSAHSAPISAPPLQSYYIIYPAHLGQLQLQQPWHQDGCYECGNIGHIRRYCPRLASNRPQQDSHAIIPAPIASPPAQPARGRGQAARGGGQAIRGGGQTIRGRGQTVTG